MLSREHQWTLEVQHSINALARIVSSEAVLWTLHAKMKEALELASFSDFVDLEGHIPAVPIVPRELLVAKVQRFFEVNEVEDSLDRPRGEPYFLIDTEVGRETADMSPGEAWMAFASIGRSPLTFTEAFNLRETQHILGVNQLLALGSFKASALSGDIAILTREARDRLNADLPVQYRAGVPSFAAII